MRSGRLNPFGNVWSNITEVITKSICNLHWVRNFLVINLENRVGFGAQFLVIYNRIKQTLSGCHIRF